MYTATREDGKSLDEAKLVAGLVKLHLKSGVMIDVGAHEGHSLKYFTKYGWRTYAFEPDAENRDKLKKRWGHLALLNIDKRAVSETSKSQVQFYTSPESSGISTLNPFVDSHSSDSKVDTVSLKEYCNDESITHINFLKIDTEGHDLFVLRGLDWDIISPDYILCEFENKKTLQLGYSHDDLANYLTERGYQLWVSQWHPIIRYGIQHDWHSLALYPTKIDCNAWGNFIATKTSWTNEIMLNQLKKNLLNGHANSINKIITSAVKRFF